MRKKSDRDALRYLYVVSGKSKIFILILMICNIFLGISTVAYALFFRDIIDQAVAHHFSLMVRSFVYLVILVIIQISVRALVRFLNEYANASFENAFKERLFAKLMKKDFASVTAVHSAEWMNRLTSDTKVIADGLSTILPGIAQMITEMTAAGVMILIMVPVFGFIIIPGGILIVALTYVFRRQLKKLHKKVQEADGLLRVFLQEHLESLIIIKSYAKENQSIDYARERMNNHKKARMERNRFSNFCNVGFSGVMNGAYLLTIAYSSYGLYHATMSYGTLVALIQLVGQIQTPFASITSYLPKYYAMIASCERLMEAEKITDDLAQNQFSDSFSEIGLRNASFTYPQSSVPVFNHFNFAIKKGEFVAFTGDSGCGKSTVLKCLMGLYTLSEGERYEIADHRVLSLPRKLFAYVPQGNLLMSGRIRDIVSFSDEEDNDERVIQALKTACAYDFVSALPDGIDTILGEKGSGLSEGQMQRIAVARAIYSARPVLLLDEATSALDARTEKELLNHLKELKDRTVIIVTHRHAAIDVCDQIIYFNHEKQVKNSG